MCIGFKDDVGRNEFGLHLPVSIDSNMLKTKMLGWFEIWVPYPASQTGSSIVHIKVGVSPKPLKGQMGTFYLEI